jgi:hypothetical protein
VGEYDAGEMDADVIVTLALYFVNRHGVAQLDGELKAGEGEPAFVVQQIDAWDQGVPIFASACEDGALQ